MSKIFATIALRFDHLDLWNLGILGVAITYLGRIVSGQFFRDWVPSNRSSGTNFKFRRVYAYAICTILGAPGTNFKFRACISLRFLYSYNCTIQIARILRSTVNCTVLYRVFTYCNCTTVGWYYCTIPIFVTPTPRKVEKTERSNIMGFDN